MFPYFRLDPFRNICYRFCVCGKGLRFCSPENNFLLKVEIAHYEVFSHLKQQFFSCYLQSKLKIITLKHFKQYGPKFLLRHLQFMIIMCTKVNYKHLKLKRCFFLHVKLTDQMLKSPVISAYSGIKRVNRSTYAKR